MKNNAISKVVLAGTLFISQQTVLAQSVSETLLQKLKGVAVNQGVQSAKVSATTTVSGTVQNAALVGDEENLNLPIPLTTELIDDSKAAETLASIESYNRLQELVQLAEQEGYLARWSLNGTQIQKLNAIANQGSGAVIQAEVLSVVQKICTDFYRGRVTPDMVSDKAKVNTKKITKVQQDAIKAFVAGQLTAVDLLTQFRPKNVHYQNLVNVLARVTQAESAGFFANAPTTLSVVKAGVKNKAVILYARQLLNILGYTNNLQDEIYNEDLSNAIKSFQANQGLTADGALGPQGWAWLNLNVKQLKTRLIINIDRARWLPDNLGAENVFVNLAVQKLRYTVDGLTAMEFKTINGRIDRQTPILFDRISFLMLNPTWTAPDSIIRKDKLVLFAGHTDPETGLEDVRSNPHKVIDLNMKMYSDADDTEVDPLTFDWSYYRKQLDACKLKKIANGTCKINVIHTFVQQPGHKNALGLIKFPLANPYAIYLHDTDSRHLFNDSKRLLSSGCVRLQKPFDFAERLLNNPEMWSKQQLLDATENLITPALESTRVNLGRSVPVIIFYFTTHLSDNGQLSFGQDVYGTDLITLNLMNK